MFDWVPVKSAGEITAGLVSERQLWRFIAEGRIGSVAINGKAAVRRSDLAALLDQLAAEPNTSRRKPPAPETRHAA